MFFTDMHYRISRMDVAAIVFAATVAALIVILPNEYDWYLAIGFIACAVPFLCYANYSRQKECQRAEAEGRDCSIDTTLAAIVEIAKDVRQSRQSDPGHQAAD